MSFRRVNRSKKVPNVKLRPAAPNTRRDLRTPDSTWHHSSGLDSDEDTSRSDLCPRPFKGFVLCATGINDKTSLFKLALELGAQSVSDLTDRVTHLIAEEHGSPKYRCALENRIPIMHPSWIIESHKIWLHGDDVDVPQSIKDHRLPPFSGIVLCVSGIDDVARRMEINRELTDAGGTYVKQITRPVRVTHLICANNSEGETDKVHYATKFNQVGEADIKIVWEDWFWDSLRFGGRFDEEAYLVSNPRPPPRILPEDTIPPPPSSSPSSRDPTGLSSEIQNLETSATRAHPAPPNANGNEGEEELASVKRVPAATLHLWQSILKPRGFEVQDGRLVRSPSKSQSQAAAQQQAQRHHEPSPSRAAGKKLSRRGTLKVGVGQDEDENGRKGPRSALLQPSLERARSFLPAPQHASTPAAVGVGGLRQPFRRAQTSSRTSSFLQRSVGSVHAAGGMSVDVPIASTSALAGPSSVEEQEQEPVASLELSEAGREMFCGLAFRALGEARCASVRRAIESAGGRWMGTDDDDDADIIVVRLVSGSSFFRRETDEGEKAKYRTECWLERCLYEERVVGAEEHVAFAPLRAAPPIPGVEAVVLSCSGLDEAERCLVERLCRALGIVVVPAFSRRSTHLLCPSGTGAKADKAREWSTPIVDMAWLASIANAGEIPSPQSPAPAEEQSQALDLQLLSQRPLGQGEDAWMATQPPATIPKADVKGKAKATETMVDITNAHADGAQQSLSYYDSPASNEPRPGQADQMETFGMPNLLLEGTAPTLSPPPPPPPLHVPSTPRRSARRASEPESAEDAPESQPVPEAEEGVSIPSKLHEDRIPSSESPSPMRMPGMPTPQDSGPLLATPEHVTGHMAKSVQRQSTTLLGKRPNEEEQEQEQEEMEEGKTPPVKRLQAHDSRLGKRLKPFQRTISNMSEMSNVSCTDLLGNPGQSPAPALATAASPVPPPEPDLVPQLPDGRASASKAKPASTSADNSVVNVSACVAYADPYQGGEMDKLKYMFHAGEEGWGRKEGWEMELDMDVEKEMTLPQLGDTNAASVSASVSSRKGKAAGRGRRGRGRKGAKA